MERSNVSSKKEFLLKSAKVFRPIDIVVIVATVAALYMFRLPDGYQLNPIWQLKQPPTNQQLIHAQPLITDIDGNGLKELIIALVDKIEIFSYHESEFGEPSSEHASIKDETMQEVLYHLHSKKEVKFSEIFGMEEVAMHPVAMNAGCATTIYHKLCVQSLVVVWSDWTVTLLSDQLKVLWTFRPMKIPFANKLQITEMSALVVHQNNSLLGENGLVIVGGVLNLKDHKVTDSPKHDHSRRSVPSETPDVISKERAGIGPDSPKHGFSHDLDLESAKYLGHFTTYALDAKTGEIKWKHEPGDFEETQQVPDEDQQSQQLHFKLRLRKKRLHTGEVHWSKFTSSFLDHLPYAWKHYIDADITLGNFKRSPATKPPEANVYIIPEQLQALFKTTKIPKVTDGKDGDDSNVVVLRHKHAIEVLKLENGSPVCVLPLDGTTRSAVGDLIGDEVVQRVKTYVFQGVPGSSPTCFIVASDASVRSSIHFNSSVCHPSSIHSYFDQDDESPPVHTELGILAPLLLKSVERSSSLFEHFWGYGLARIQAGLDSFVLLSSGKLVAFAPSGRFLWQVGTGITWSENKFYPSMKPLSLNFEATEAAAVIILGPSDITVVSLVDGSILATHSFPCLSTQPLTSGDINNDGTEEFLVRCEDRYLGFGLERYNRLGWTLLLYSGIAFLVGFLLCAIKFIEKDEFPVEVFESVTENLRLFPVQVPRR